jgi:tetratricopeptide (TPR) repeat protein
MLFNSVVESRSGVTSLPGDDKTRKHHVARSARWIRVCVLAGFFVVQGAHPFLAQEAQSDQPRLPAQQKSASYRDTLLRIQQQIESGSLDAARAQIAEAFKAYPADGGLYNLLGIVEIQQGHPSEARRSFTAAIHHDPRLTGAYLNLSRMDMETAATDPAARSEALRLTEKVLAAEPANDEANYQAATILAWEQNYQRSLEHLQKLSAHARGQVGAQALLCADSAGLSHREETDRAVAALIANSDLTEQDANTCIPPLRAARRADLIDALLSATAARQALSPQGLRTLGLAQEAQGKLDVARATLENAFSADPKSVVLLEDLSRVAQAARDYKGALGYIAHARDLEPDNAHLAYEFGSICARMGLLGEARKANAEALKLDPENADYNLGMGTIVSFSSDPSQAIPYLMKYQAKRPQDPAGMLILGEAYYRGKDFESATAWLKRAVPHASTASEARFYLGKIAHQENRLDEAIAELNQSLALRPGQPEALAELGQIAVTRREFSPAAEFFDRAIKLDPDNYGANFGLLQLYARTGDPRRDQQSKRFDEIKKQREEQNRETMRSIEIRASGTQDPKE